MILALMAVLPIGSVLIERVSWSGSGSSSGRWAAGWRGGGEAGARPSLQIGLVSLSRPGWTAAAAMAGCIYLGLAGLAHLRNRGRNRKETIAMVSDLGVAAVLAADLVGRYL